MLHFVLIAFVSIDLVHARQNVCGTGQKICDTKVKTRLLDGSCNNIEHPEWGSALALYKRLLPAQYDDGISSYRKAKNGKPLPNARLLSSILYTNEKVLDPKSTLNAMQFGQLFAHDLGNRYVIGDDQCCSLFKYRNSSERSSCQSIPIPPNDPVYSKIGGECLPYKRTATNIDRNCSLSNTSTQQVNQVTAYLDLHPIYGYTEEENKLLRTFKNGLLKVRKINNQDWFTNSSNPSSDCPSKPKPVYCFNSADNRINQNPHLAIQNVMVLREHNRVAAFLAKLNPHWDDEKIFQTARIILIGMFQHISLHELMPVYVNKSDLYESKILFESEGFVDDYDPTMDGAPFTEFAQAAFRHGHSMIAGPLNFASENRKLLDGIALKDSYHDVAILLQGDNFDLLTRGLTTQHSYASDAYHEVDVTNYLVRGEHELGEDVKAIDIQRSRDHGVASYNEYRVLCNLTKAKTFSDFSDVIDTKWVEKIEKIYDHPDDVDLAVGGSLERLVPGGMAGPTFTCIWIKQLKNIRVSDRFFYDHTDGPFTLEQLKEIRKASVSRWYCDNSKNIKNMQPKGFLIISETNKLVPCESLPKVDLTKWKESSNK